MVYFLNSKVKTHTEDALQYIFDENKEKNVIFGYNIVSRRYPYSKWSTVEYSTEQYNTVQNSTKQYRTVHSGVQQSTVQNITISSLLPPPLPAIVTSALGLSTLQLYNLCTGAQSLHCIGVQCTLYRLHCIIYLVQGTVK